jgi:hypothetical protein
MSEGEREREREREEEEEEVSMRDERGTLKPQKDGAERSRRNLVSACPCAYLPVCLRPAATKITWGDAIGL